MQQVIVFQITSSGEGIDESEPRPRAVHHRDGYGAVQRYDR